MKDKERIKEMAKDMGIAFQLVGTTSFIKVAEILVEKYTKIPEGSVVLSDVEYSDYLILKNDYAHAKEKCEKLQADNERLYKNIGKFKESVRKETAEKLAEKIQDYLNDKVCEEFGDNACDVTYFTIDVDKVISDVFEIARQFGVEVEE